MARSEEGREEFMNTNVFDQQLSQFQMESLAALQDRLRKNPGQDMRVVKAMNWLRILCLRVASAWNLQAQLCTA